MTIFDKSINKNIENFENAFEHCGDIVARKIRFGAGLSYASYITYIDGLVDRVYIEEQLIKNLIIRLRDDSFIARQHFGDISEIIEAIKNCGISSADIKEVYDFESAALAMMSGDCILLADGSDRGIVLSSKGWPNRGIGQPETEMVVQGPKEAFTETIRMNTALIRRRIRDINLKIRHTTVGRRSSTDVAVVYLDDVVRKDILAKALEKIAGIDIDAILDSGYIEQFIEDNKYSPFPQAQVTERPDKAAAAILEGRIAIIVDNSPFVILIPTTLNMFFQSSEDYYQRFEIMSFMRLIRYMSAFLAISLSGLYLALTVYHPAMIPSALALKMAAARMSIPFPAVVEVLMMDIAFELLREAGVRLPGMIGSTLGIVGGLIIGQAAVEAGIVSPVVVIVVALSGIASFALPSQALVSGIRLSKYLVILLSAVLGLFGYWIAILLLMTHIVSLKSFGIPYLYPFGCSDINKSNDLKDSAIRAPLHKMVMRPFFAKTSERKRMTAVEDVDKK